jgi:hypothetical protein
MGWPQGYRRRIRAGRLKIRLAILVVLPPAIARPQSR